MKNIRLLLLLVLCSASFASFSEEQVAFTDGKTFHKGFQSFYYDQETAKVFLQIDNFEQQFLFQSSLPHGIGSNDIGLDRGQLGETRLVQFERVGNKVFLRQLNTYYRANSENALERQAIDEAFASSIIWGFKVEEQIDDAVIIDYTPFLLSDIHNLAARLKSAKQGSFSIDSSRSAVYKKRTKAFVDNTELEAIVTFKGNGAGSYLRSVTPDASAVSVNLHHSLIRLPDSQYQTRAFHPYSGMWSIEYADYASAIDESLIQRVIPRHRLSKKNPNSKISEPVEPIIYYLDPGVPEPIRSALIDGALWWDQAFSAIGYKNAFQVKMLPADADPMDVRYNVIQWVHRATRGWSYGASVVDPRTGEIIKGHVTLGSLRVRQDYLIALGLTSPFNSEQVDTTKQQEMALARIRQLSAHEVGHTLGIAHNFSASVNDRASVMDYPHPYITLDEQGNIDLSQAYDKNIGVWDKHVINYAYADFEQEQQGLANVINQAKAQGLQYMSDPDARPQGGAEASGHLWDNGPQPTQELNRVLQVREQALTNFGRDSIKAGTPFSELEKSLVPIYNFHRYQVEATAKVIAGVHYNYAVKGEDDDIQTVVNGEEQQQALTALLSIIDADFLTLPDRIISLIPPQAYGYGRTRESFASNTSLAFDPVTAAQASAKHTLGLLLNPARLARLNQQHNQNHSIFSVSELIKQLLAASITKDIAQDSQIGLNAAIQTRINQQVLDSLLSLFHNPKVVAEVKVAVYANLIQLQQSLKTKTSTLNSEHHLYHQYLLLAEQINFSLKQGEVIMSELPAKLPPGSPIG